MLGILIVATVGYVLIYGATFSRSDDREIGTGTQETSTTTPQGKINIDAVCEDALSYMTFTNASSADAFVEECKEGKHPEVIDRYKEQMNLGVGATL